MKCAIYKRIPCNLTLGELEEKLKDERKQGALVFAYWLVNAPNKEIHSKKWIEQKYEQYLREIKEKEGVEK